VSTGIVGLLFSIFLIVMLIWGIKVGIEGIF
jgi:hypothetical protein